MQFTQILPIPYANGGRLEAILREMFGSGRYKLEGVRNFYSSSSNANIQKFSANQWIVKVPRSLSDVSRNNAASRQ